jgi:hypothetical protein
MKVDVQYPPRSPSRGRNGGQSPRTPPGVPNRRPSDQDEYHTTLPVQLDWSFPILPAPVASLVFEAWKYSAPWPSCGPPKADVKVREYLSGRERTDLDRKTFHPSDHALQYLDCILTCYVLTFGGFFGRLAESSKVTLHMLLGGTEMPPHSLKRGLAGFRKFSDSPAAVKLNTDSQ